ncbi:hypothetical protein [Shewanella gaetbuli]
MNINEQLQQIYSSYISGLNDFALKFSDKNLNGPLLIKVKGYIDEPLKLMCVGQETYGWDQSLTIEEQLNSYEGFNFGSNYSSSPFWNVIRKMECALGVTPYSIAWSNLNRFDQNVGSPSGDVLEQIVRFDSILTEEIKVLDPDVCIFFTNYKYDTRLNNMYEGLVFENIEGLPPKHFAKLTHPLLPNITIRAPHPKTIRIRSWEDSFIRYIQQLA